METETNTKRKRKRKRKYSLTSDKLNPYALLAARLGLEVDEKNTAIFVDKGRKRYVLMPHGFVPTVRTNAQEDLRLLSLEYENLQSKYATLEKALEKQKNIAQNYLAQLGNVQEEMKNVAKELDIVVKECDTLKKEDDVVGRKKKSAIIKILGSKFRPEVQIKQIADYLSA